MSTKDKLIAYANDFNNMAHWLKVRIAYIVEDVSYYEIQFYATDVGFLGTGYISAELAEEMTKEEFYDYARTGELIREIELEGLDD